MELHITLVQSDIVWENSSANLERFEKHIQNAPHESDVIVLPEMFSTAFSMKPENIAVPLDSEVVEWIRTQSAKYNKAIIAGVATLQKSGNATKNFNSLIWSEPNGTLLVYNKRHLFRMAGEHKHYSSGTQPLIIHYKGWRIRPFICYDLRFPVWCRNIARHNDTPQYEYDCAIFIANWPEARRLHWSTLLKARAIENQAYVIGVNRIGTDFKGFSYSGDSAAIDPAGDELTSINPSEHHIETVCLSKEKLETYRTKFPFILDADFFTLQ